MPGIKTSHIQGELQYSLTFWIHKTQWNSVPKCTVSSSDWISSVQIDVTFVHFIFSLLKLAVRMTCWNICPRKYLIFDTVACSGDLSAWGDGQSCVWPLRGTQWSPTATVTGAVPHSLVTGRNCSRCHEKQPKTWWPSSPEWASPLQRDRDISVCSPVPQSQWDVARTHDVLLCYRPSMILSRWFKINITFSFLLRGRKSW